MVAHRSLLLAFVGFAFALSLYGCGSSSSKEVSSPVKCFNVALRDDREAIPDESSEALSANARGFIKVTADSVDLTMDWNVSSLSASNPVVGIHIHAGNHSTNGPILVGFCGQHPLPPFSGKCEQQMLVRKDMIKGEACNIKGAGSPCIDQSGNATLTDAAATLMNSKDPEKNFYLNLHTARNPTTTALGLIRGQLTTATCTPTPPPVPTPTPTSSTKCFKIALRDDRQAIPDESSEALSAHASGFVKVTADSVNLTMDWNVSSVSVSNPIVGIHIHTGNHSTNGPILVGFCGQHPLPPFSGKCEQQMLVRKDTIKGEACNIEGKSSPCINQNGNATLADAAATLMNSKDPEKNFYLNLHTARNPTTTALGLIRGQLISAPCDSAHFTKPILV